MEAESLISEIVRRLPALEKLASEVTLAIPKEIRKLPGLGSFPLMAPAEPTVVVEPTTTA